MAEFSGILISPETPLVLDGLTGDPIRDAVSIPPKYIEPTLGQIWPRDAIIVLPSDTELAMPAQLVTSLPSAPDDGEEIYYQDAVLAAAGVIWKFRYRAASTSAHKWEYAGGGPMILSDNAQTTSSVPPDYVNAGASSYSVALPGDYVVQMSGRVGSPQSNQVVRLGVAVNGAVGSALSTVRRTDIGILDEPVSLAERNILDQPVGTVIRPMHKIDGGAFDVRSSNIRTMIRPLRVG